MLQQTGIPEITLFVALQCHFWHIDLFVALELLMDCDLWFLDIYVMHTRFVHK